MAIDTTTITITTRTAQYWQGQVRKSFERKRKRKRKKSIQNTVQDITVAVLVALIHTDPGPLIN
jgi:hypothetical protein